MIAGKLADKTLYYDYLQTEQGNKHKWIGNQRKKNINIGCGCGKYVFSG